MTLELRQICLRYAKKTVLDNMSLTFCGGAIHALLGENGAGKSTTANIICGELLPDSGNLLLDGRPVLFHTPREAIQTGICYVHQRPMLADYISVKENLLLGLKRKQKQRLGPQAEKWLPGVKLNSLVKNYGADRRFFIALTSALIKKPSILILDEPSALLDDTQSHFLFQNLRELADGGMNIIVITHNYDEAQKYCDTVTYLEDGRVINDYKPEDHKLTLIKTAALNQDPDTEENLRLFDIYIQKGKITLVKGLSEDGLDQLEKKLLSVRTRAPERPGIIPTDRKFTGSNPNLTIEEMLTAALKIPENQKAEAAKKMIEASGVNITPQEKCSNLSGGMLQKLMFEREFYGNPELLILCNPLQGLDVDTCERICKRIHKAALEGAYVLVLSYGAFPSEYCNIEYKLKKGQLEAV